MKVDFHLLKIGVPTSVLRTTGFGPNVFAVESFMDELAHRARQDPYTFRRRLLEDERSLAVLDLAAEKAGWTKPLPPGAGRGIAYAEAFRTHIAHVVELSVEDERVIRIHRVVCVIDCGTALDPEITKSSLEGGTVWGLGAAFKSAITVPRRAHRGDELRRLPHPADARDAAHRGAHHRQRRPAARRDRRGRSGDPDPRASRTRSSLRRAGASASLPLSRHGLSQA